MQTHTLVRASSPQLPGGTFQNRQPGAIVKWKVSGPGRCLHTSQNLTRPDLLRRSAMASTPDCRVTSASLSALAAPSGSPTSSDSPSSLAADAFLQQQLSELAVIHRRLRGLLEPSRPTDARGRRLHPASGDFLLIPEVQRFQHAAALLEAECGTLLWMTQRRLTRLRIAVRALREQGGVDHVHH